MADNNIFFVNGVETSSAAEVQTALDQATSGISISVWNGDITFSGDHTSAGAINLNVGGTSDGTYEGGSTTNWCTEFQKDNTLSSTVTFNSDFKGTVAVFTGTNSEDDAYSDSTAENANMRLIFDGAEVTGGNFYNFNYGYIEFKNGAKFDNKNGTGHIRGDVLVTGEGTDVKIALERVYGDDFGADNIVTATLTVADGARFYDTVGDANVLNLGKTASNRQGKIIINGGTFQSKCTIAPATYGTISISNSTVNGKTYYGKMLLDSTAGNPTLNFSGAAANALTISVNSADYADLKESYKIIELADPDSTLDMSKISVTVDGAAYTLGTTFADCYSINQVDNDLVLTYTPPPPIKVTNPDSSTQNFDSLLTANEFAQDGAVVEFVTSSFTDATVVAAGSSLILDKDITFKGKTTATFGITGSGYLMFGNTTTKKAINVTVAEGSDITFGGLGTGLNFRYGEDSGKKVASTLTVDNARLATSYAISSNGLVTVKGAGVKGTYGIGEATADTLDAKYLVANLASKNNITVKDRFDNYADDVALRLTDYAYVVAVNGITIGSEDGTITSIVSVENSKIEFINSAENSSCAFRFTQAHGNKLQISGDSEVLVREFDFAKEGIITIDGADAYVRAAKITVADGASATLNVTLTTEQLAAQSLELGVNTAIFEISGSGDNLLDTTVMLDGAAYTLGDEIVDDAGNKYVINMGDANGDSVENDLVMTLTEKAPEPVVPEGPGSEGESGGASTEPSQKVYINPYYNENTLGYFSDVVGEELVLGKNAFTSVAAAKKALGANADIEYCTSAWNSSFSGSSQLEGIAKISNNSGSMGFNYGNFVSRYNMANGALNLNKVTADTDFENFAMVNVSGSNLSGAIENNSFAFSGTGTGNNASGTAWFAQGGMVNISGSTVGEVTGYAYATLNGSDVDVLSNNNILFANVKLENGEISSISNAVTMSNGMAQINNSFVGLLENYAYATMRNSDVVEAANVTSLQSMGGANSIGSFTSNGAYSQIVNGYGSSLTLGDVTMNGSFDSIVNYGGTLVLTGNLKGVEMLYGYGDLVASDEQIKQLGGAEKVKQTYFGDIVDLGSTADGFSGKAAELADNSEAKAVIWDAATEGGLRGWLGIGSDVDVKDSVDYVKFTAAADGTLDITSSAWSSTGDKVSINGTDLAITDGAATFGVTAGTEYLVKIERKDNNSMSYDMTLA